MISVKRDQPVTYILENNNSYIITLIMNIKLLLELLKSILMKLINQLNQ